MISAGSSWMAQNPGGSTMERPSPPRRDQEEVYAIVYLDGFHLKVGERSLDALGLRAGGTPRLEDSGLPS